MERGRLRAIGFIVSAKRNGGILGIRISLVAQEHVQIREPAGRQEQRIVGRAVIDRRRARDAQAQSALQHRFVGLD